MPNDVVIDISDIYKSFTMPNGKLSVLNGISLPIYKDEFVCLLGYSGCGKSTLLRIIAQLEKPDSGTIKLEGKEMTRPEKDVLLLYQDFNQLFPWLTVKKNVMFPGLRTKMFASRGEAREKAEELLKSVGLLEFQDSYPHQLSGGMKQRVAIARVLALQPKVLLMDEPFAALDAITRAHLQELTKKVCAKHGVTVVFVTHNVEEAVLMGSKIVIMSSKTGTIERIIENPPHQAKETRSALIAEIVEILNNQLVD